MRTTWDDDLGINSSPSGQQAAWPSSIALLLAGGLGILAGFGTLVLGGAETRWTMYALAGLIGLLNLLATRNKDRLLCIAFALSLQIDVYLRLSYGRAGSTEGIALPLVVIAGATLLLCRFFVSGPLHLRSYRFDGLARKPILAVLLCTMVSVAASDEQFIGIARLVFELELFFIYWLTFNLVRDEQNLHRLLTLLMVTLTVQSIVMYVESALGVNFSMVGEVSPRGAVARPGGTVSSNPAGYSSFITPALLFGFAYFVTMAPQWRPKAAHIATMLGLVAIGLTFTRASWAGTVLGMGLIIYLLKRHGMVHWRRVGGITALIMLAALVLLPTMAERLSHDYGTNAQSAAWQERWGLMRIAFNIIAHHPLTGIGAGAYDYAYRPYIPGDVHQWTAAVHNEFLLRAAETGLPGLVAFVALIVAGFRIGIRLLRSPRREFVTMGAAWIAGLASLVWQMSWVPWRGFTYNAMLWFMLGLMDAACRFSGEAGEVRPTTQFKQRDPASPDAVTNHTSGYASEH